MKIIKILLTIVSVLYPFAIVYFADFSGIIVAFLAILWVVRYYFAKEKFALFIGLFFVAVLFVSSFKFIYPVIISAGLFFVFLFSLKTTPMITKIALFKDPNLSEEGKKYTRNLTKIWIGFFAFNAFVSLALGFLSDKSLWAIYCGVISYLLIGTLFFGEILYRRFVLKI
ncbi:MAG: DNA gyrase subunit B [Campylobacter sp.]|nr:DNA gyrase subunit B [Campylobacter sp.]